MLICAMLTMSAWVFAQTGSISGKVFDEKQQTLPGATVAVAGTTIAGSTDINGVFKISGVKNGTYTVTASFIGYTSVSQSVTINNGNVVANFSMQPAASALNEVVVIGYGTSRKKDLTGSVTTVSSKDFQTGSVTTPEQLISGKVAGVSITSNSGAPGAGSTIRIRGGASLNASNDPLYVIDGVQLSNDGISGIANPLATINPNDIETFTILKDASATAIYGSRASNGVIIITTKKGTPGKTVVTANTQASVSYLPKELSVLSADQFRTFVKANGTAAQAALLGSASTDWQKQIYQTSVSNDNNVAISGGSKTLPYRVSAGFLDQNGILKTGSLDRTSLGVNLSPKFFTNHLKIDVNVKGSNTESRFANESAIGAAVSFDPTKPVYSGSKRFGGYYEWLDPSSTTGLKSLAPLNPVGLLNQKLDQGNTKRSIGNIQLDYKFHFLPDLHANVNLGYDASNGHGTTYVPDSAASGYHRFTDTHGVSHSGTRDQYKTTITNTTFEGYLNYARDIKSIQSHVDVVAGYAFYDYKTTTYNYPDKTTDYYAVSVPNYQFDSPEHTLLSYYGRVNYSFMDRYLLTGTIRRDGSSRFGPDHRYGTFPSAALAWNMKEEPILKDSHLFSTLKLRVGYGLTGQQDGIGNYDYISYYNLSGAQAEYQLGNTFYQLYRPGGFYPDRKWEQSATTNVGIDYGFLDGRITGAIDAYYKNTTDLLNSVNLPAGSNFSNKITANVGDMVNRGIEFSINGEVIKQKDLTWNVAFNATYNENKITKLTTNDSPDFIGNTTGGISGGTGNTIQINSIGYPKYSFYVYQQVYDANGKPLDGVFVDRNGDGVINEKDLYRYKSPDPKFFLGFSTNVNYQKWTAGFSLRANLGNYMYNNVFSNTGVTRNIINPIGILYNGSSNVLESGLSGNSDKNVLSDYYIQNASFLRMDNINIGYNFGKLGNSQTRLSVNANVQNVFVITKYKGLDPESNTGIDNNIYPRPRTFVLGLNLNF